MHKKIIAGGDRDSAAAGGRRGPRYREKAKASARSSPRKAPKSVAKKKKANEDYKKALQKIPDSTEKQDPWKTMR